MIKINIPNNIENCIERLERAGYEAYIVGGCVRDAILGREPNDWDLCTSALPNDIKDVFEDYKTIDIGANHGTIAVVDRKSVV